MSGVRLLLLHPEVATRDCGHCQKWLYSDKTGRPEKRGGIDVERPKGTKPPCRMHIGCPKGTPEDQKSLSPKNRAAWRHYQECRAVGSFPDDPIVRRNAAIIRAVEDTIEGIKQDLTMARLGALGPFVQLMNAATRGKNDGG